METRQASYDNTSHGRSAWLDDITMQAKRYDASGKLAFSFTIGITQPISVCEEAFFAAADISGGSRTSAMAAARAGRDRRHDRILRVAPLKRHAAKDEILLWQARYVEFRGHKMPHLELFTTFIDKERRATMFSMFKEYCTSQGIHPDQRGKQAWFTRCWNNNFLGRDPADPRGQVCS